MDVALLLEAERRGILPADKVALLAEARRRGLVPGGEKTPNSTPPPAAPAAPGKLGFVDDFIGGAKATLKGAVKGATGITGMLADVPFQIANMAGADLELPSQAQSALLDRYVGETPSHRGVENLAAAGTGAMLPVGMAQRAAGPLAEALAANPGAQLAGALGGEGARQGAEEMGAGALGQTAASLLGGVAGTMAPQAVGDLGLGLTNKAYRAFVEPRLASGREAIKGRTYLDAAGDRAYSVAQALRDYEPTVPGSMAPAGEAAAGAGSAEFAALQDSAERVLPSEYVARGKERDAARLAQVRSVGRDEDALAEAIRARKAATVPLYAASDAQVIPVTPDVEETLGRIPTSVTGRAQELAKTRGEDFALDAPEQTGRNLSYLQKALRARAKDPTTGLSSHEQAALSDLDTALGGHLGDKYQVAEDTYREMSEPVNQMRIGQFLERKLTSALNEEAPQRAEGYAQALRDAPKSVKSKVGGPRLNSIVEKLTPDQVKAVESVRDDLANMAEYRRLANAGRATGNRADDAYTRSVDQTGKMHAPNLLNRTAMLINWVTKRLEANMDAKLAEEIAREMLDPKAAGDAMAKALRNRKVRAPASVRYSGSLSGSARGAAAGALPNIERE